MLYIFLIEKKVFNGFFKIVSVQNQLPITFCSDLVFDKTLKVRNFTPKHTNFLSNIKHIKSKQCVIRK